LEPWSRRRSPSAASLRAHPPTGAVPQATGIFHLVVARPVAVRASFT
jgi:hypothetical protein